MTQPQLAGASATNRRKGRGLGWGLFAVFGIPVIEVILLVLVGRVIGVLPTLGIILASTLLGIWLARREGSKAWRALNDAFASGRMPGDEVANGMLVFVGAWLLMLPGYLSDLVGLVFLLPATRPWAKRGIGWLIARWARRRGIDVSALKARTGRGRVIAGETVEEPASPAGFAPEQGDPAWPGYQPATTSHPADSDPHRVVIRGELES